MKPHTPTSHKPRPDASPALLKGRGIASTAPGRFAHLTCEPADDGWYDPQARAEEADATATQGPVTQLYADRTRRLITTNRSPDIPFDQSINPYKGCEHGCVYCYARPTHAYLDLSPGLDFETKIFYKTDRPEHLMRELSDAR